MILILIMSGLQTLVAEIIPHFDCSYMPTLLLFLQCFEPQTISSNCDQQPCNSIARENYTEHNTATLTIDLFPFIQFDSETKMWGINYYSFLFYPFNSIIVILIGIAVFLCVRLLYRYMRK